MIVNAPIIYEDETWRVPLPTYRLIPGTIRPQIIGKVSGNAIFARDDSEDAYLKTLTVDVEVPNDEVDPESGMIDWGAIRRKYQGQRNWDKRPIDRHPRLVTHVINRE